MRNHKRYKVLLVIFLALGQRLTAQEIRYSWKVYYDSALYIGTLWDGSVNTADEDGLFWNEHGMIMMAEMAAKDLYDQNPNTDTAYVTVLRQYAETCKKDIQFDQAAQKIFKIAKIHKKRFGEDPIYAHLLIEAADFDVAGTPFGGVAIQI